MMPLDKLLQKIRTQIKELSPALEMFTDDSTQPLVSDCDKLQKQLFELQENLAVFKYNKTEKELSPSFNIHARVSEAVTPDPPKPEPKPAPAPPPVHHPKSHGKDGDSPSSKTESRPRTLVIGVNDKFRFINELFVQNAAEYNIALEQLNNLSTWSEADLYLNSLKNLYGWKENSDPVKHFYSLVKKRYA